MEVNLSLDSGKLANTHITQTMSDGSLVSALLIKVSSLDVIVTTTQNIDLSDLKLWSCQKVSDALHYPLDTIFKRFGPKLYRQIVGIPMDTN